MKKVKTCIVTGQYPPQIGGVGHSANRVANLLANNGLEVHVVNFIKHPVPVPFDEAWESTQEGPVLVHRIKVWNPSSQPDNQLSETTVMTRYHREMFDALRHFQEKYQYDVLHSFFLFPAGFITGLVARMHGVKHITSIRGNDVGKYAFDPLRMPMVKSCLENADFVTSVATSMIELADRGITPIANRAKTIINSINFKHLAPNGTPAIEKRGLAIGSIGLFRYKKGIVYLSKALGQLRDQFEFTFLLAGDYFKEEDREPHLSYFRENGLEDRTIVTGKIPHKDIANYLQFFDILVFPSLFSEGCPLSMLEGMAMGKPVIGTRCGAIPEVIRDRENGLLVSPGSAAELAAAISELAGDEALRKKFGEKAAETVQYFSQEKEVGEWLSVYRNLMG